MDNTMQYVMKNTQDRLSNLQSDHDELLETNRLYSRILNMMPYVRSAMFRQTIIGGYGDMCLEMVEAIQIFVQRFYRYPDIRIRRRVRGTPKDWAKMSDTLREDLSDIEVVPDDDTVVMEAEILCAMDQAECEFLYGYVESLRLNICGFLQDGKDTESLHDESATEFKLIQFAFFL